jgi:two-component system OmpR family sensor kinase
VVLKGGRTRGPKTTFHGTVTAGAPPVSAPSTTWSPERLDALNRQTTVARLLSTAVHETSNSLQVIAGNAEMIEAQAGPAADPEKLEKLDKFEKLRTRAQAIKAHADRAGARLRALVALASGQPAPRRPVDLKRLAEVAIDLRRYTLARARVSVTIDGEPASVLVDELAVTRILANLILNAEAAVTARPDPAIAIRIGSVTGTATVTVADTGPGVPAARAATLFDPFVGESGCGLAVSRWLAEAQGGRLEFDTHHSSGAVFVLTLPVAPR